MRVSLEPATAADFNELVGVLPVARARALAAKLGDQVIGLGGFLYMQDGTVWASMIATPAVRKFPTAMFRGGVLAMRMARRLGLREIFASTDKAEPAAERFLERLGFARIGEVNGEVVFRWRP